MTPLLLSYYGDDFTGSTDALEFLSRAGARTALFIEPPSPKQLARYPDLQAVGVAGMTRSLDPIAMEAELRPAFSALRSLGARHVHYKVCSTFDSSPTIGNIGRALEIGASIFGARFVPLLVGAPALGRYCVFGNLFARMGIGSTGEIHRLDRHPAVSRHPITPANESDLRLHLGRQTTKRIGLFDILSVDLPGSDARTALEVLLATQVDGVLFDVLTTGQLPALGALIDPYASQQHPLFSIGSSGIEMALGAHWAARQILHPRVSWPAPGTSGPMVVASGSCSPVTGKQISHALEQGFAEIPLDAAAVLNSDDRGQKDRDAFLHIAAGGVVAHLRAGRHVIVHTSRGQPDSRLAGVPTAQPLGTALGGVVRRVLEQIPVRRLLLSGGDSSSYAARALGIEAAEMLAPLAPGAPLCRVHAPGSPADRLEVNFKGGQVGAADYFSAVARGHV